MDQKKNGGAAKQWEARYEREKHLEGGMKPFKRCVTDTEVLTDRGTQQSLCTEPVLLYFYNSWFGRVSANRYAIESYWMLSGLTWCQPLWIYWARVSSSSRSSGSSLFLLLLHTYDFNNSYCHVIYVDMFIAVVTRDCNIAGNDFSFSLSLSLFRSLLRTRHQHEAIHHMFHSILTAGAVLMYSQHMIVYIQWSYLCTSFRISQCWISDEDMVLHADELYVVQICWFYCLSWVWFSQGNDHTQHLLFLNWRAN